MQPPSDNGSDRQIRKGTSTVLILCTLRHNIGDFTPLKPFPGNLKFDATRPTCSRIKLLQANQRYVAAIQGFLNRKYFELLPTSTGTTF